MRRSVLRTASLLNVARRQLVASPLRATTFSYLSRPVSVASAAASSPLDPFENFAARHLGATEEELETMLATIGKPDVKALMKDVVPEDIHLGRPLRLPEAQSEHDALAELRDVMDKNVVNASFIGQGYYGTLTPNVILRNMLENPNWYTPYTPYQAEISQGRMESLMNFQQMVSDLTGLEIANASLLDEGTASAEAMGMAWSAARQKKHTFFVDERCFPATIAVIKTRAEPLGIKVVVGDHRSFDPAAYDGDLFGAIVQYPAADGTVDDLTAFCDACKSVKALPIAATDLLALTLIKSPGDFGFEIAVGNSQRFGVPMGYGGPHAAFMSTTKKHVRKMPGRLIGVTNDADGNLAYRLTLQTREQHIRREKATSNVCTAQALLANVAAMYACYHGPTGLKAIAERVNLMGRVFKEGVALARVSNVSVAPESSALPFFDTVRLTVASGGAPALARAAADAGLNLYVVDDDTLSLSFDETTKPEHITALWEVLLGPAATASIGDVHALAASLGEASSFLGADVARTSDYLTHPVFSRFQTEHEMLRYMHRLQERDIGLQVSMIPLGSCTMKLNATAEMIPVTWETVGGLHPFAPLDQAQGYAELIRRTKNYLCEITGFDAITLQPNSGAQGEYTGLYAIREYHRHHGGAGRNVCLIPDSAHGTNPASAAMAGMKVVAIATDADGNVDIADLKAKAEKHADKLAAMMLTYPSTFGVFEQGVRDICDTIHANGGLVYLDGANMNAQVGVCRPGDYGADVCHLNLHKTFCIPHGGGGPGLGTVGVNQKLAPFLPTHPVTQIEDELPREGTRTMGPVASAHFSSASILPVTYMYLRMMGPDGLRRATELAITNANYMMHRLENDFTILYKGKKGYVAHEFLIDLAEFKKSANVDPIDIAKRLQDYSFHAPTVSWPSPTSLSIEITESEPIDEMDRFVQAMLQIRAEIAQIEEGVHTRDNNLLKNAPHPIKRISADTWDFPYSRQEAAYPVEYLSTYHKHWPSVGRVDDVAGDRNLVCSCPPMSDYE